VNGLNLALLLLKAFSTPLVLGMKHIFVAAFSDPILLKIGISFDSQNLFIQLFPMPNNMKNCFYFGEFAGHLHAVIKG